MKGVIRWTTHAQGCDVKLKTSGSLFQNLASCLGRIAETYYSLLSHQQFTRVFNLFFWEHFVYERSCSAVLTKKATELESK